MRAAEGVAAVVLACDDGPPHTTAPYALFRVAAAPTAEPTAEPTAARLVVTSVGGADDTCTAGTKCKVAWDYLGHSDLCTHVRVEAFSADGDVVGRSDKTKNESPEKVPMPADAAYVAVRCTDAPEWFSAPYDAFVVLPTPTAEPTLAPSAPVLEILTVGAAVDCVAARACPLTWAYTGDPDKCAWVTIRVLRTSTGDLLHETAERNTGAATLTAADDADLSGPVDDYTLALTCIDAADDAPPQATFALVFAGAPTAAPTTPVLEIVTVWKTTL